MSDPRPTTTSPRAFAVTLRSVLAIAVPMTLAHATTPLVGLTDMAVIGQLGSAVLIGAVALGALLFDFLGTTFSFLRMGTTGLVAQAMGAGDAEAEALTLWRALLLALAGGLAVIALQVPLAALFVLAMGPSEAVAAATREYFSVRVWGMPLMLANYAILGWLLGLGRAATGLALQVLLGVVNISGSVLLVLGLGLGVTGVAAASVAAEAVTLAAGLAAVLAARLPRPVRAAILEPVALRRMLMVNGDILVRSVVLMVTFSFFTAVGARFGDVTLAANALLMNLFLLGAFCLDGLATAAEQLGGRAVGARHRPAFDRTVSLTLRAGLIVAGALAAVAFALGDPFVALMTTSEAVRETAAVYLPWAALTPLFGMVAFVMDGVFIGATWTATMRNMMLASTALFLVLWWAIGPLLGNHGLWLAFLAYLGARGVTLWAFVPRLSRRTFAAEPPEACRATA